MSILNALFLSRRPAAAFVVVGMFWGCFAAYVPHIKATLEVSDAMFGTLLLGSATGLVSSMWLAPIMDRWLGERALQVGVAFLAAAWLVPGFMSTPLAFAASLALVGLASGLLDVIMNARVSMLETTHETPLMNANHAMFSVAYGAAALVVAFTRETGLPPAPVFAGFAVLSCLIVSFVWMEVTDVAPDADSVNARYPLWPIIICGAVVLVAFMSEATVEAWSALHLERTLHGGAAEGALGPVMLGLTMAIGRFSGQAVAARWSEITVVIVAAIVSACGAVIAAFAPVPLVAYVGFGILGLGVSVIGPMGLALVGQLVAPHLRTEAIGRTAVIGFSGFFFAPVLMGVVSDAFGLRMAFAGVALLLLTAVPLALLIAKLPKWHKKGAGKAPTP